MPARRSPRRLRAATALVGALLLLTGCSGVDAESAGGDTRYIEGEGTGTAFEASERVPAPEVTGETLDGDTVALDDYAGQVVIINFWASWCTPCRAEKPVILEVLNENSDDGLAVLGVNIKDNRTAAERFAEEYELPYPSIYDQPGEVPQLFRDTVPPQAIPSTLIIDRQGRIAARVIGQSDYTTLSELVEPIVAEDSEAGAASPGLT